MSRRTFLASAGIVALGAVAWGTANLADRIAGGARRFTGSRWLPDGGIPPVTTFYGEPTPPVDLASWRLDVGGQVARPLSLDLAGLTSLGVVDREEILDCTSGWAMRTSWRGTPLPAVLAAAGASAARSGVEVHAVTGWMVRLAPHEVAGALLATHVAGDPLPAGNGAPVRLVVPSRRGLDWIKWVDRIEVA